MSLKKFNVKSGLSVGSATVVDVIDSSGNATFDNLTLQGLLTTTPSTKANNSTGTEGQIAVDADYIYVCTATNTWKRVALSTF